MKKFAALTAVVLSLLALSNGEALYRSEDTVATDDIVNFQKYSRSKRQAPTPNTTTTIFDHHDYYTSTFYPPGAMADSLWLDVASLENENVNLTDPTLSTNFQFYATHPLLFEFPYYGHILSSVAVTTGGFLYTSDYTHPELIALTHTIAPLQANFNPTVNDTARILIHSTDERFTVQWDKVHNHDHIDAGPFTFQVSIFKDGTIHFVYREIPLGVSAIDNNDHPVDVGLSDSFYIDKRFPGDILVRSVFEYSRISLNASEDLSNSAYILKPVLNCVVATSCEECSNITSVSQFVCDWCSTVNRCSDGIDRYTQEWFESGCFETAKPTCTDPAATLSAGGVGGISVVVVILLAFIVLVVGGAIIVYIGYKRPTSKLGLWLIEHRPKARTLNKSSASYDIDSGRTELKQDLSQ